MATFFLLTIYFAFISLGLPDSLLGSAWPVMRIDLGAPLDAAGIISFIISGATVLSSLSCDKLVKLLGSSKVTLFSVLATAFALLGFSYSGSFIWLMLFAIPLGFGAGAVDATLNNYVALHYKAKHMNWLHSFWGIGAFIGPIIMGSFISNNGNWQGGYRTVSILQFLVVLLLIVSLPMWKKRKTVSSDPSFVHPPKTHTLSIAGVGFALSLFFFYSGGEYIISLWSSSFLTEYRNFAAADAANALSLYYLGITFGRILSGFISIKIKTKNIIFSGILIALLGIILFMIPLASIFTYFAFLIIGLGCAPIFPNMIHETPINFGEQNSQKIIGLQMAAAYCGSTFLPPIVGVIASNVSILAIPFLILLFISLVFICFLLLSAKIQNTQPTL